MCCTVLANGWMNIAHVVLSNQTCSHLSVCSKFGSAGNISNLTTLRSFHFGGWLYPLRIFFPPALSSSRILWRLQPLTYSMSRAYRSGLLFLPLALHLHLVDGKKEVNHQREEHVYCFLRQLGALLIIVMDGKGKRESDGPCLLITSRWAASSSADTEVITPPLWRARAYTRLRQRAKLQMGVPLGARAREFCERFVGSCVLAAALWGGFCLCFNRIDLLWKCKLQIAK